jgi:hypothetical protein
VFCLQTKTIKQKLSHILVHGRRKTVVSNLYLGRYLMKRSVLFMAISVMIFAAANHASAVDGQIKIAQTSSTTFPVVINKAGSYVLTTNLVVSSPDVNGINIMVNDVTLDLNGHKIQGPGTGYGIYAEDKFSITLRNGRIWGFSHGIALGTKGNLASSRGAGHHIEDIQALNNIYNGIYIEGGTVINCTANNNGDNGIEAYNSVVINCIANNNRGAGIYVDNGMVTSSSAQYNEGHGMYVISSTAKDNNSRYNGGYGIETGGVGNYIYRNAAVLNTLGNINCSARDTCVDNAF